MRQFRVALLALLFAGGVSAARPTALVSLLQAEETAAKTGVIKGNVTKNGTVLKRSRFTVTVVGTNLMKAVDAEGAFEFPEVPAGKYVLKVKGTFKGVEYAGEMPDVEPAPKDKAEPISIPVM